SEQAAHPLRRSEAYHLPGNSAVRVAWVERSPLTAWRVEEPEALWDERGLVWVPGRQSIHPRRGPPGQRGRARPGGCVGPPAGRDEKSGRQSAGVLIEGGRQQWCQNLAGEVPRLAAVHPKPEELKHTFGVVARQPFRLGHRSPPSGTAPA